MQASQADARAREAAATIPVYGQLPFVPVHASGCDIITGDGRRILDLYGGHAVAALGYGHPRLVAAIRQQSAQAAEKLVSVAPASMERVFFANSGAEANENALRMACSVTQRSKVLAITHGFHGRTAAPALSPGTPTSGTGFRKNRSRSTSFRVTTVPRPSR
jgi:4-aminobutyrate aminotransferase-like enzyme